MTLGDVLATTLWSVPLCSFLTGKYLRMGRIVSVSLGVALVAYLAYSAYEVREANYYDYLGVSHTATFEEIQLGFRRAVQAESEWSKAELERMYQSVRGSNRPVYAKYGDHMGKSRSVSVDQVVSIGHSVATTLLLASVAAIFLSYRPTELINGSRVYLLGLFCLDFWVREVDHTFLPLAKLDMLPFEFLNLLVALFPAVCCGFITLARYSDIPCEGDRKTVAIQRLLTSNDELIRAIQNLPVNEELKDDVTGYYEASDSGALLSQGIAALLLLANIFLATE